MIAETNKWQLPTEFNLELSTHKFWSQLEYCMYTVTQHTKHAELTEFQPPFYQITRPDCQMSSWTWNTSRRASTRSELRHLFGRLVLKYAANGANRGGRIVKEEREISSVFSQSRLCSSTFLFYPFSFFFLSVSLELADRDQENCTCSVAIFIHMD